MATAKLTLDHWGLRLEGTSPSIQKLKLCWNAQKRAASGNCGGNGAEEGIPNRRRATVRPAEPRAGVPTHPARWTPAYPARRSSPG